MYRKMERGSLSSVKGTVVPEHAMKVCGGVEIELYSLTCVLYEAYGQLYDRPPYLRRTLPQYPLNRLLLAWTF
jgi:hypothetical protein